ncbi:MAG: hypothetical protein JWN04_2243 [Myxococcaceae bacterium]|nr:hypothetical protein [Myxococcaceae bacterium]
MRKNRSAQATLFELPPPRLHPAPRRPEHVALAAELPPDIRLGGMTWTFPGWIGLVYAAGTSEKLLAAHGLAAYAQHPLLRTVELDRTYYEPLSALVLQGFAAQVPEDFSFFVKAHEDCVVRRFPLHPRYGPKRGQDNLSFLDPSYAERVVIEPLVEGLGQRLGGLLFQFPPQDVSSPALFAQRLHVFLSRLPKGITYAVELRNRELLTREYGQALEAAGAIHCHSAWTAMPSIWAQARLIPPSARRPLLVRWLLRQDHRYEDAGVRYAPFNRLVEPDVDTREAIARLVVKAHAHGVPVVVLVDNKAEGCAPESIALLAQSIVQQLRGVDADLA